MNNQTTDIEGRLCALYAAQRKHYDNTLQLAKSLSDAFNRDGGSEQALQQLAGHLDQVAQIDKQLVPLREEWKSLGRPPGSSLNDVIDGIRQALEQLVALIDTAEKHAQQAKARLTPEMDAATRRHRMLSAYTDTLKRT